MGPDRVSPDALRAMAYRRRAEAQAAIEDAQALERAADALDGGAGRDMQAAPAPSIRPAFAAGRDVINTNIVADILDVEVSYVYRLARQEKIIGWQGESGLWFYDRASVEDYAQRRRPRRPAAA